MYLAQESNYNILSVLKYLLVLLTYIESKLIKNSHKNIKNL